MVHKYAICMYKYASGIMSIRRCMNGEEKSYITLPPYESEVHNVRCLIVSFICVDNNDEIGVT